MIERLSGSGTAIRAGIHTGECEVIGDDLAGIPVHVGARIAALGRPGELLVSSKVKDLVGGSGIGFEHHGEHALKGVSDPWRVLRVLGDDGTDRAARTPVADDRKVTAIDRALVAAARRNPRLARPLLRRGA
jgi:class 3 adenylate cyclase